MNVLLDHETNQVEEKIIILGPYIWVTLQGEALAKMRDKLHTLDASEAPLPWRQGSALRCPVMAKTVREQSHFVDAPNVPLPWPPGSPLMGPLERALSALPRHPFLWIQGKKQLPTPKKTRGG